MRHNTQITADAELEILRLEPAYVLRDRVDVVAFLQEHVVLIDLLTDAAVKIREYFGSETHLALEMFRDQDDPSGDELFVRIQADLDPSIARANLDRLDENWWIEASLRSHCKMNIALE